ncbi:hypothetical protein ACOBWA_03095 [Psychrobacter sp. ER1]|uniref:hypothetical protein n=1 Tax=Psychrobacter sp. ER1 TaxID=3406645 RepID=UPI003B434DDF
MKINRLINQPFVHLGIAEALSDRAFIEAMIDFELAVLEHREQNQLIPKNTFQQSKHALDIELFDIDAIGAQTYLGGNAAIPFVAQAKSLLPSDVRPFFIKH